MPDNLRRPLLLAAMLASVAALTAATQGAKFPAGSYKANNGTADIVLAFDTTGTVNVLVDGQQFSNGTWQASADTLSLSPITSAPEGYNCAGGARYLWSMAENRLTFTRLADDCEIRIQSLTGLAWTKG